MISLSTPGPCPSPPLALPLSSTFWFSLSPLCASSTSVATAGTTLHTLLLFLIRFCFILFFLCIPLSLTPQPLSAAWSVISLAHSTPLPFSLPIFHSLCSRPLRPQSASAEPGTTPGKSFLSRLSTRATSRLQTRSHVTVRVTSLVTW